METQTQIQPLTALDRCDSCAAAALVQVGIFGSDLLFCNHHFNKHKDALESKGAEIIQDNTASLNIKIDSSVGFGAGVN